MTQQKISSFLRQLGILKTGDYFRYLLVRIRNMGERKRFVKKHPGIALPPDYMIYESFRLNYDRYYEGGRKSAKFVLGHLQKFHEMTDAKILDWGCGPARIIRHLPALLATRNCTFYGTDYNHRTIDWCTSNINGISFHKNGLLPPLSFESSFFDIIYGISIFTHLSGDAHEAWIMELADKLKTGGVLLITTQGKAYQNKLSPREKKLFQEGRLVVRANTKEGHRTYSAFHPENYMLDLLKNTGSLKMESFVPGELISGSPSQDIWVLRKNN